MPYEKNENGIVARSEESITLMTSYCLPHHGNRSFAVALDDILPIFLTTETDSSHSFRMAPYRLIQGSWSCPSEGARWRT